MGAAPREAKTARFIKCNLFEVKPRGRLLKSELNRLFFIVIKIDWPRGKTRRSPKITADTGRASGQSDKAHSEFEARTAHAVNIIHLKQSVMKRNRTKGEKPKMLLWFALCEMWLDLKSGKKTLETISTTYYSDKYRIGRFTKDEVLSYITQAECPSYEQLRSFINKKIKDGERKRIEAMRVNDARVAQALSSFTNDEIKRELNRREANLFSIPYDTL